MISKMENLKAFTVYFFKRPNNVRLHKFRCDAVDKWDALRQFNKYHKTQSVKVSHVVEK